MQKIKTMPHGEKYTIVLDRTKSHDVLLSPFFKKHLDEQALVELKELWQEGAKPIPEDAPVEEKYEIAYGNLMWQGKSNIPRFRIYSDGQENGISNPVATSPNVFSRVDSK